MMRARVFFNILRFVSRVFPDVLRRACWSAHAVAGACSVFGGTFDSAENNRFDDRGREPVVEYHGRLGWGFDPPEIALWYYWYSINVSSTHAIKVF